MQSLVVAMITLLCWVFAKFTRSYTATASVAENSWEEICTVQANNGSWEWVHIAKSSIVAMPSTGSRSRSSPNWTICYSLGGIHTPIPTYLHKQTHAQIHTHTHTHTHNHTHTHTHTHLYMAKTTVSSFSRWPLLCRLQSQKFDHSCLHGNNY